MSRTRVLVAVVVACVCLIAAAAAWAAETLTVTAAFSPDKLGAPTNVHGTAIIRPTTGLVPSPIVKTTVLGPAGLGLDVKGVGICNQAKLEAALVPSACPKSPRAGFGGWLGALELAQEVTTEKFTLNSLPGTNEDGHIVIPGAAACRHAGHRGTRAQGPRWYPSPSPTDSGSASRCR
jgi:hypothetical protein